MRVQVSTDGAKSWNEAKLETPIGKYAWCRWSIPWHATPGKYCLCARATDDEGFSQDVVQKWNVYGMGNNMVQMVEVIVLERGQLKEGQHVSVPHIPKSTRL